MFETLLRGATRSRVAGLMVLLAAGGLLWHVLACVESPMAFSPDGKSLAFVTMEPFELKGTHLAGPHCFRLFVASGGKDLRLIEQTTDAMLTAPAYSPDGKQICYFRIPLLTEEQARACIEDAEARDKLWQQLMSRKGGTLASSRPAPAWKDEALSMPETGPLFDAVHAVAKNPALPAELVLRNAADYSLAKTIPLDVPIADWSRDHGAIDSGLIAPYVGIRPQYSKDGQWIYLCLGSSLTALNPQTMTRRILALPGGPATLSPDGKNLAFVQNATVAIIQADGQKATYLRWPLPGSADVIGWRGDDVLAILSAPPKLAAQDPGPCTIVFLRTDGTLLPAPRIPIDAAEASDAVMSSDGQRAIISAKDQLLFFDREGKQIQAVSADAPEAKRGELPPAFTRPTFAPDGKSLAVKLMRNDGLYRAIAVVFFSPDGKELSRVAIPPIAAATTRPASAPATAPARP